MIYHNRIFIKYSIRYNNTLQYSLPFLEKKKLTLTNPKNGNLTHYQNTALPPSSYLAEHGKVAGMRFLSRNS